MKPPRVILVTAPPAHYVKVVAGFPTRERAEVWAAKNGYPVVYWDKRLQRVYVKELE